MKKLTGLIVLLATSLTMSAVAQDSRTNGLPEAQYTAEGMERCMHCHGGERMTLMAETAHGNLDNPHTPWAKEGCESCHGPGSLHASRARGGRGFPSLVTFARDESAETKTQACIGCHAKVMGDQPGMEWTGSAHDTHDITCTTCHTAHAVDMPLKEQQKQTDSCTKCHKKQIAAHSRFEDKGIVFDKLTCYDCHDVHQLSHEP
jgi:DmsE family decaheme c-type cytochrome